MAEFFSVRNFETFQHYKDRNPPWIKLYNALLDDYSFAALADDQKCHLLLIWLLASRMDNKLPRDPAWIGRRIGANSPVDLDAIEDAGFIEPWDDAAPVGKREDWPSRYIPEKVRAAVFDRDRNRCRECRATANLEVDHVVPVSKGGKSELENLQLLCRKCNRRKRNRLNATEQVATQTVSLRSLETERETETKGEESRADRTAAPSSPEPAAPTSGATSPPAPDLGALLFPVFPCIAGRRSRVATWSLPDRLLAEWGAAFPGVNVPIECRKAHAWVKANLGRRKTAGGMEDFLFRWLGKCQNGGGRSPTLAGVGGDDEAEQARALYNARKQ